MRVERVRHQLLEPLLGDVEHPRQYPGVADGPGGARWPGWTRRSAAPVTADGATRCASWPAPARARRGCSPGASPTGRRPATPTPATCSPSPSPARRPASSPTGCAALGLRDRLTAGTFHAIAYAQLRSRGPTAGRAPPVLLERKARLARPPPRPHDPHDACPDARVARSSGPRPALVAPDGYAEAAAGGRPAHRPRRPTAVGRRSTSATRTRSAQRRVVDFDDLLAAVRRGHRGRPEFAAAQRWRFRHLFVDEFQDVNPLQFRLLDALARRPRRPVRGRRPQPGDLRLERRRRLVPPSTSRPLPTAAEVVELDDNYRSTPQILASPPPCSTAAGHGRSPRDRPHRAGADASSPYPTDTERGPGIARAVRDHHAPGPSLVGARPCSCAPTPRRALIEEALRRGPHPVPVRGAAPFLDRPEVVEALGTLAGTAGGLAVALGRAGRRDARGGDDLHRRRRARGAPATSTPSCSWADELPRPRARRAGRRPASLARPRRSGPTTARAAATPSRSPRSTPPRASSGRSCTSPGSRTASSRSATPARAEAEAEERRLLYVAITRAEEVLRCTWAERRTFGQTTRCERRPSPLPRPAASTPTAALRGGRGRRRPRPRASRRARAHLDRPDASTGGHAELLDALRDWRDRLRPAGPGARRRSCSPTRRLVEVAERRPTVRRRPRRGARRRPGQGGRYGATVLDLVATHSQPAPTTWTADGALRVRAALRRSRGRRRRRLRRPGLYAALGRAAEARRRPRSLEHEVDGDEVVLRIRYRFSGDLSSAATGGARPGQAHLGRASRTTTSPRARVRFALHPDHYARPLLVPRALPVRADPPTTGATIRTAEGDLKVRALLVGRRSRALVSGLEEHLADEVRHRRGVRRSGELARLCRVAGCGAGSCGEALRPGSR